MRQVNSIREPIKDVENSNLGGGPEQVIFHSV